MARKKGSKKGAKKAAKKPGRVQITATLDVDVARFLQETVEKSGWRWTRSRVLDKCMRLAQALLIADEILQAYGQLQNGKTDGEHLDRCKALISDAAKLISLTKSEVLMAVAVPLDAAIRKIDDHWLQATVTDAEKEKVQ